MSEITDLGSPDRELSARDIERKENKLRKTKQKLTKNLSGRRRHNLNFKLLKTKDQIDTGMSGIRPVKQAYKGTSRKSALNMIGDPEVKKSSTTLPAPTPKELELFHKTESKTYKSIKEQKFPGAVGVNLGKIPKTGASRKSALNMLGIMPKSPLNDMTEAENAALDAVDAAPDSEAVDLGTIKPSRFTKLKTKLENAYTKSGKSDEFRNKKGGGDHQDFYYDPNKFSKPGKNYHGVIPGDNKMGMIRSGAIEYPEDMEGIPEHYKGKNWVPNKK